MSDASPFASGAWRGFYVYGGGETRHPMSLHLKFHEGNVTGDGDDDIGPFLIRGHYVLETLEVYWTKAYLGKHSVYYRGFGEPARIWGTWELPGVSGGFKIWPEGGAGGARVAASAEAESPADAVPHPVGAERRR